MKARALEDAVRVEKGQSTSNRRLVLRFLVSPVAIAGTDRVEAVDIARTRMVVDDDGNAVAEATENIETIDTGLLLRSIGYRGQALVDLPFDARTGTLPNRDGRVTDPATGAVLRGTYTAGWIKRGPSGVIGTNRADAASTVEALLDDYRSDRLDAPTGTASDLVGLVETRQPERVSRVHWQRIDEREAAWGREQGRPRVKFTGTDDMLLTAQTRGGANSGTQTGE